MFVWVNFSNKLLTAIMSSSSRIQFGCNTIFYVDLLSSINKIKTFFFYLIFWQISSLNVLWLFGIYENNQELLTGN